MCANLMSQRVNENKTHFCITRGNRITKIEYNIHNKKIETEIILRTKISPTVVKDDPFTLLILQISRDVSDRRNYS